MVVPSLVRSYASAVEILSTSRLDGLDLAAVADRTRRREALRPVHRQVTQLYAWRQRRQNDGALVLLARAAPIASPELGSALRSDRCTNRS